MLDLSNEFTIVANYNLKRKELNIINIKKGEIPKSESLKPVYHLPSGVLQSTFINLIKRTFESIDEISGNIVPNYLIQKYRL